MALKDGEGSGARERVRHEEGAEPRASLFKRTRVLPSALTSVAVIREGVVVQAAGEYLTVHGVQSDAPGKEAGASGRTRLGLLDTLNMFARIDAMCVLRGSAKLLCADTGSSRDHADAVALVSHGQLHVIHWSEARSSTLDASVGFCTISAVDVETAPEFRTSADVFFGINTARSTRVHIVADCESQFVAVAALQSHVSLYALRGTLLPQTLPRHRHALNLSHAQPIHLTIEGVIVDMDFLHVQDEASPFLCVIRQVEGQQELCIYRLGMNTTAQAGFATLLPPDYAVTAKVEVRTWLREYFNPASQTPEKERLAVGVAALVQTNLMALLFQGHVSVLDMSFLCSSRSERDSNMRPLDLKWRDPGSLITFARESGDAASEINPEQRVWQLDASIRSNAAVGALSEYVTTATCPLPTSWTTGLLRAPVSVNALAPEPVLLLGTSAMDMYILRGTRLTELSILPCGLIGPSHALTIASDRLVYVSNDACDGALREIVVHQAHDISTSSENQQVETLDTQLKSDDALNMSPIRDFKFASDRATMYLCSGSGHFGSLRILRHGARTTCVAESSRADFLGCSGIFAFNDASAGKQQSRTQRTHILLSFPQMSGVIDISTEGKLEKSASSGFRTDCRTIAAGVVSDGTMIQIHSDGVRATLSDGFKADWSCPSGKRVTAATVHGIGIVLQLQQEKQDLEPHSEVHCVSLLWMDVSFQNAERDVQVGFARRGETNLQSELSCMTVASFQDDEFFLLCGSYKAAIEVRRLDASMSFVSSFDLSSPTTIRAARMLDALNTPRLWRPELGLAAAPESVVGFSCSCTRACPSVSLRDPLHRHHFVLCGLRDGTLLRLAWRNGAMELESARCLGSLPVRLFPVQLGFDTSFIAASSEPWLIRESRGSILASRVFLDRLPLQSVVQAISCIQLPGQHAFQSVLGVICGGRLFLLAFGNEQNGQMHCDRVMLRESPKRICLLPRSLVPLWTDQSKYSEQRELGPAEGQKQADEAAHIVAVATEHVHSCKGLSGHLQRQITLLSLSTAGSVADGAPEQRGGRARHPTYVQSSLRFFDPACGRFGPFAFQFMLDEMVQALWVWEGFLCVGTSFGRCSASWSLSKRAAYGRLLVLSMSALQGPQNQGQNASGEPEAKEGHKSKSASIAYEMKLSGGVFCLAELSFTDSNGNTSSRLLCSVNETLVALALVPGPHDPQSMSGSVSARTLVEVARTKTRSKICSLCVRDSLIAVGDEKDSVNCYVLSNRNQFINFSGDSLYRPLSDALIFSSSLVLLADKQGRVASLGKPQVRSFGANAPNPVRDGEGGGALPFSEAEFSSLGTAARNLTEVHAFDSTEIVSRMQKGALGRSDVGHGLVRGQCASLVTLGGSVIELELLRARVSSILDALEKKLHVWLDRAEMPGKLAYSVRYHWGSTTPRSVSRGKSVIEADIMLLFLKLDKSTQLDLVADIEPTCTAEQMLFICMSLLEELLES
ncbi:Splicing factor 3B subunit 3 [Porphyridium purpureum]|uniref:Splicing factor 3B subunit 3 n=1 Tax=Porphyridium purpureum TaxID=35688 RepID=A0A5J4Z7U2_PORPP|nr:Splicing factor 3B subunit 3 [Porphyridium purpureum]|eukprot:POR7092..scf295_1